MVPEVEFNFKTWMLVLKTNAAARMVSSSPWAVSDFIRLQYWSRSESGALSSALYSGAVPSDGACPALVASIMFSDVKSSGGGIVIFLPKEPSNVGLCARM